ncbi:unnamed protein product [Miscanthus lutarioriparius]|uniref:DEAD-box RNA helicase Q domain-containing protein n=1 Tax=Miscanthus lutarioriparius TaxID=422564 RepID=A0A811QYS7_9POAL|nr:unnamed protein product [Miscanthus lutarioriparius]
MPAAPVSAATVASSMAGSGASLCRSSPMCCYCWESGSWGHLSSGLLPMGRPASDAEDLSVVKHDGQQTNLHCGSRQAGTYYCVCTDSFWQRARLLLQLLCQDGGGSMLGGIGSTIAQGMTFGTVSAMAHRVVDAVLGPGPFSMRLLSQRLLLPLLLQRWTLMLAASILRPSKMFLIKPFCLPVILFTLQEHGETEEFFTSYDEVFESFDDMGLQENLLRGIYAYGLEKPSAIQQRGIVPFCKGLDVIQQAQFMRALGD